MKKLLIPVFAVLMGATPAHAGSVWLIMKEAVFLKSDRFSLALERRK